MPLWRIFSAPETFSTTQRQKLAQAVTALYVSRGLPAFYVVVLFIDTPADKDSAFVGGEARSNFVRVVVEQIARSLPAASEEDGKKYRTRWMDMVCETLKPYIQDRAELDWELHIAETPRDLWRIQGMDPPPSFSEAEKLWSKENKPVPYKL